MTRAGSTDGPKVRDAIAATKDFPGVTGAITINSERNAVKSAVILKVENGKYLLTETVKPEAVRRAGTWSSRWNRRSESFISVSLTTTLPSPLLNDQ